MDEENLTQSEIERKEALKKEIIELVNDGNIVLFPGGTRKDRKKRQGLLSRLFRTRKNGEVYVMRERILRQVSWGCSGWLLLVFGSFLWGFFTHLLGFTTPYFDPNAFANIGKGIFG